MAWKAPHLVWMKSFNVTEHRKCRDHIIDSHRD